MSDATLTFTVGGERRSVPREWWDALLGPKPDDAWADCDGCTGIPERLRHFLIWPACRIHDWQCSSGVVPRVLADLIFRINLWRLVRMQRGGWLAAVAVAIPLWLGVSVGALLGIGRPKRKV